MQINSPEIETGQSISRVLKNRIYTNQYFRDLGYSVTGPLFLGYALWIIKQVKQQENDSVYFLARDGWYIRDVYDYLKRYLGEPIPDSKYLYASRRAMLFAGLSKQLDANSIKNLISSWWHGNKIKYFLDRVGIDANTKEIIDAVKAAGFPSMDYKVKEKDFSKLNNLFSLLSKKFIEQGVKEKTAMIKYFKNEGLFLAKHPVMVDIGWAGTMQKTINQIVTQNSKHKQVDGLYLGTNNKISELTKRGLSAKGFVFSGYEPASANYLIWQSVEILEFMFSAPHPTTLYFKTENGKTKPVLSRFNNTPDYIEYARDVQGSAMEFVKDFLKEIEMDDLKKYINNFEITPNTYIAPFINMALYPQDKDVDNLRKIKHIPGLGDTEAGDHIVETTNSYFPNNLKHRFEHAYWENGFLHSINRIQKVILFIACKKYRDRLNLRKTAINELYRHGLFF